MKINQNEGKHSKQSNSDEFAVNRILCGVNMFAHVKGLSLKKTGCIVIKIKPLGYNIN